MLKYAENKSYSISINRLTIVSAILNVRRNIKYLQMIIKKITGFNALNQANALIEWKREMFHNGIFGGAVVHGKIQASQ